MNWPNTYFKPCLRYSAASSPTFLRQVTYRSKPGRKTRRFNRKGLERDGSSQFFLSQLLFIIYFSLFFIFSCGGFLKEKLTASSLICCHVTYSVFLGPLFVAEGYLIMSISFSVGITFGVVSTFRGGTELH